MHFKTLCNKSYRCLQACPVRAISVPDDSYPVFNRELCSNCSTYECASVCCSGSLKRSGFYKTVSEVIERIRCNIPYYKNSGGGITLSGGEPLLQPLFVERLLNECKSLGISTGIETCGYFNWNSVNSFVNNFDFIYFDIKVVDDNTHCRVTGRSNRIILLNLAKLNQTVPDRIIITIPVIPGINSDQKTFVDILNFIRQYSIKKIRLLPFHSFGTDKYAALGREYDMEPESITNEGIKHFTNTAIALGFQTVD